MFKVKMKNAGGGFSKVQWAMQCEAAYWWAKAWNDSQFQKQILTFSYTYEVYTGILWWKKKVQDVVKPCFTYESDPRDVVLSTLLAGEEGSLKPGKDETADVEVILANQRGVLGWTYGNTLTQWLSAWFINSSTIAEQAGNRAHEYAHKVGYDHPSKNTWDRPYSVPYAVGNLVVAWVNKNYTKGEYAARGFELVTDVTAT